MNSKAVSIGAVAVISVATGIVLMAPRASEPSRRSDRAAIQEQPSGTARIGRGIPDGTIKRASPDHRSVPGGPDAVLDRSRAAGDPRTWVEANRPLVTASDHTVADLETDMLRVFRGMIEGRAPGQRDLLRFITAEDALRLAFDEDLNGVLDDEEVARFHEAQARFDPNTHPFVEQVMDLDGDGTVSDEERMTAMERFQEGSAAILEEMSHLPTLVYWDDNLDGQVDDAERSLRMNDPSVIAQFDTDGDGALSDAERQLLTSQVSVAFYEYVSDVGVPRAYPPSNIVDWREFDADSNGELSEQEREGLQDEWIRARDEWQAAAERVEFESVQQAFDSNLDGVVTQEEAINGLRRQQEEVVRRTTMALYDTDGDGTISMSEFATFTEWYDAEAPRADADLNGVITPADVTYVLQFML